MCNGDIFLFIKFCDLSVIELDSKVVAKSQVISQCDSSRVRVLKIGTWVQLLSPGLESNNTASLHSARLIWSCQSPWRLSLRPSNRRQLERVRSWPSWQRPWRNRERAARKTAPSQVKRLADTAQQGDVQRGACTLTFIHKIGLSGSYGKHLQLMWKDC